MSVYQHHGSFFARWFDEHGEEHRRAFVIQPDAVQFEKKMRREVKAKRRALKADPTLRVGKVGDLCDMWSEGKKYWYDKEVAKDLKLYAGELRLNELNMFACNQLLDRWHQKGLARNTQANFGHVLKRILKWFETLPGCPRDLSKQLRRVKSYQPRQEMLTVEEERKLLELSKEKPWLHCWLLIFLNTGFRMSEVCSLSPRHYNRETRMLENVRTKGDIRRFLPVNSELRAILDPLMMKDPGSATPFIWLIKGGALTFQGIRWNYNQLKKKAGVPRNKRPHDLRATAITSFHMNQVDEQGRPVRDIIATQRFAGHKYIGSTQLYLRAIDDQALAPLMEKGRILRFKSPQLAAIAAAKKTG
jgi:integrase